MKKQLISIGLAAACAILAPRESRAGSIDYLTNQSADYIRILSRNAGTDAADVVTYNPAGTAFLPADGLYLNLNSQTILKDYTIAFDGATYGSTEPTPVLPSFFAVYKWRSLAAFAAFTVPAGGGSLSYEEGVPYLKALAVAVPQKETTEPTSGNFSGSSMYLAGTVGAAYELFGMVSAAAALRVISAKKTYEGEARFGKDVATLNATKTAAGLGGIFGLHIRPLPQLDIGVRYETPTALELETESTSSNLGLDPGRALESFANGAKEKRNLPGLLGVGIAYRIFAPLLVSASLNYYFIKQADSAPDATGPLGYVISYDDDYDNGLELAFGAEYQITKRLLASAGYNRTIPGGNSKTYYDFEYTLPSNTIGGGVRINVLERLDVTGALAAVFYEQADNEQLSPLPVPGFDKPETFDKFAFVFALGVQYRLF